MNMNCPMESRNPETLVAYAAGKLDPAAAQALEQHLAQCAPCRMLADQQAHLWRTLDLWEAPACSLDFDRRLYRRVETEVPTSWWARAGRFLGVIPLRQALPVTAMAGLLLMAGLILREPGKVAPVPRQGATVRAEQVERTMDDVELLLQYSATSSAEGGHSDAM